MPWKPLKVDPLFGGPLSVEHPHSNFSLQNGNWHNWQPPLCSFRVELTTRKSPLPLSFAGWNWLGGGDCGFPQSLSGPISRDVAILSLRCPTSREHFLRVFSTPPIWCATPPSYMVSHRHICAIPYFATYRAIIVRYPIQTSTKKFCDTIATSIAQYEKCRCWASKPKVWFEETKFGNSPKQPLMSTLLFQPQTVIRRRDPGPFLETMKETKTTLHWHFLGPILRPIRGGLKWLKVA